MLFISGARLVADKQVRIALTKMIGIGLQKAIHVCYRLGISGNIKIKELTKYQIDQIEQMIGQYHVVHWEWKRGKQADIERLISISCYRGIRHQDGLPLRGQRTCWSRCKRVLHVYGGGIHVFSVFKTFSH